MYQDIENKLEDYFRILNTIADNEKSISFFKGQLESIENDIKESNIFLNSCISAVNYSNEAVQSSYTQSQQETALEQAFEKLEKEKIEITNKIYILNSENRRLKEKAHTFSLIIDKLNKNSREFIEMRYRDKEKFEFIAIKLGLSSSTIWRYKQNILNNISVLISHQNNRSKVIHNS